MNLNTYVGKHVAITYAPITFISAKPVSKAEEKLRESEASDEIRHAVNTWLYTQ